MEFTLLRFKEKLVLQETLKDLTDVDRWSNLVTLRWSHLVTLRWSHLVTLRWSHLVTLRWSHLVT
jgi:hypothetical protein